MVIVPAVKKKVFRIYIANFFFYTNLIVIKKKVQTKRRKKKLTTGQKSTDFLYSFGRKQHSELLPKYFKMFCDICSSEFQTFNDAKKHYRTIHNEKGYLICNCDKKLHRNFRIVQHCQWHENPKAFEYVN